ncbi:GNAT family N-acetyltransferase [Cryobacterium sp. N22]|uniref:GNAT family N-acetyltransferase n=1 Tax=Cryobacterium sp. N22 TaxID=2048290 RepID=UPI000CE3EB15|nr:GNAT family N-acetyltransferase [Cryobacterium sp. N22]
MTNAGPWRRNQGADPAVVIDGGTNARLSAASMWARATALRDGLPQAAPAGDKLPGIEAALAYEGAQLFLAQTASKSVGFAVVVPREITTEVLYLAVDPEMWGQGVGKSLLEFIRRQAQQSSKDLELWVIEDNDRAVQTYERAGWTRTQDVKVRNDSGRVERRYTLSH